MSAADTTVPGIKMACVWMRECAGGGKMRRPIAAGAFFNLVSEMARDKPDVQRWLQKRDNFMSDTIQNEIIELVAHEIQREIVTHTSASHFVGLTADGTTDGSGIQQFAVCLQYVDKSMLAHTAFLGFYNPPDSKGETLATTIVDVLTRSIGEIIRIFVRYCSKHVWN